MTPSIAGHGRWLRDHLLPYWRSRARHPTGGFVDVVDPVAGPDFDAPRSLLVQARLSYSFAAAAEPATDLLTTALETIDLIDDAFAAPDGGFVKAIDKDSRPIDPTRDFYDMTFVMLASAWLYRRTGDRRHIARIDRTQDYLDEAMAHPAGGWRETAEPRPAPRRQNPHMHLLEALLAAFEATGHVRFRRQADRVVDLLLSRFLDPGTGTLIEFFDEMLQPAIGPQGTWREPGHHFEWTWLLVEHHRLTAETRALPAARALYGTAMRYGFVPTEQGPQVIEAIDPEGCLLSTDRLLWPQTEYAKAEAALGSLDRDANAIRRGIHHLQRLRIAHFSSDGVTWRNRISEDAVIAPTGVPTRVLYHIVFSILALENAVMAAPRASGGIAGDCC